MLSTLHTLLRSAPNRSDEKTGDHFAFIIIDQKIRQKNQSLKTARQALAALIEAEQKERNQIALIEERVSALCVQTKDALSSGKKELAKQVAHSIAAMENELKGEVCNRKPSGFQN